MFILVFVNGIIVVSSK
jgi:hypothetical protein